jgi:hypothetical protein
MKGTRDDGRSRLIASATSRRRMLAGAAGGALGFGANRAAPALARQAATPAAAEQCVPATRLALGLGHTYAISQGAGQALTIRFADIENDSRCPYSIGAVCVWEGEATVVVGISDGDGAGQEVRITWRGSDAFALVWSPPGQQLVVAAVGLSGDSATPRPDLLLDLLILADWTTTA